LPGEFGPDATVEVDPHRIGPVRMRYSPQMDGAPDPGEIAWARKVVAAAVDADARGVGAYLVDGHMIDKPFVDRARAVVALADRLQNGA